MKKMRAGIIGGTHGMGRWMADLLRAEGFSVRVAGRTTKTTAADLADRCDVVVVAVPIAATADVIQKVGPRMQSGRLLMDLTSLKTEPVKLMLAHSEADVVGCHPLFGPSVSDPAGHSVVLCRGRGENGYAMMKALFQKARYRVLETTPRKHDEMMSIVQALNHFNTIVLGMAVAEAGIPFRELQPFSTPMFKTKIEMVQRVLTETPGLYADILAGNPRTEKIMASYACVVRKIRTLMASGDAAGLKKAMENTAKTLF
ncbi:MAG TPA: prephenate dehydrogenase/arogenate dehydrogenase family protein [Smithellaceae bacterium]|nr:prephenate dehydrogenase/arogenate dehydrogenase family protein [Smithellaceae bacterium]HRS81923.1 prephenate dehydrogenase/arogenate dehydrogenase family protein [Smithellaceae bacterium]HRV44133.1 prephenate dehydrogenase/arogenate dehydrogenase family protein [Smithellaceae bacterium]